MNFQEFCNLVPDYRRGQGQRITKDQILTIIMLAGVCGYFGARPVARFAKAYAEFLKKELKLKHKIPSHVTFFHFINHLEQQEVIEAFNVWSIQQKTPQSGEFLSFDGKCLKSTVSHPNCKEQNYVSIVSIFSHHTNLTVLMNSFENVKDNEINIVQQLVGQMKGMGVVFFGDAAHSQKNS